MEQDMKTAATRIRTIDLGYEQMMIFDDGYGERVRVLHGATWLTQEGEPGDAVLRAGTELPLSGGRTLIEALEPAHLQILGTARPPSAWRRLARRLRRGVRRLQFGPVQPEPVG
jgi:hypothetical protein